jgi:hypothetical protein
MKSRPDRRTFRNQSRPPCDRCRNPQSLEPFPRRQFIETREFLPFLAVNNGQFGLGHLQQESHHTPGDSALEVERCALSVFFRLPAPAFFFRFSWTILIRTLFNSSALRHLAGFTILIFLLIFLITLAILGA